MPGTTANKAAAWFDELGPEARYARFLAGATTLDDRIDCLVELCLASNSVILRLLSRLGPMTISSPEAGVVEIRISPG